MTAAARPLRVVLVTSVVARHDAISGSFLDLLASLRAEDDIAVTGLAGATDAAWPGLRCVDGVAGLLTDDDFCAADAIIYEFGIWYEGFNALLIGNGHGRQVVRFHNITPPELVPPRLRPPVLRSFEQLHNIGRADEVWPVSPENAHIAIEYGAAPERVVHLPLSVRPRVLARLADKPRTPLGILFVGRFVPAKGVHDLLEACQRLRAEGAPPFEAVLAGNEAYSDPAYLAELRTQVAAASNVRLRGTVDDAALADLLRRAHVLALPSYHEGFGKPVIEGLAAGCVPVGYASAALPHVVAGFGRLVEPGDVGGLARALRAVLDALAAGDAPLPLDRGTTPAGAFDTLAADYVAGFAPTRIGARIATRLRGLAPGAQTAATSGGRAGP